MRLYTHNVLTWLALAAWVLPATLVIMFWPLVAYTLAVLAVYAHMLRGWYAREQA